jgi:adenylate cyclase
MRQLMHYAYVDHAWCSRDAVLAREHAEHVLRIADAEASPYSRVLARSSAAIAAHVAGELSEAKRQYAEALRLVRETRVGVDFEAEILAGLAECHLELCEFDSAATIAQKAADVSSQRSNRVAECSALVTLACALAADAQLLDATALLHRAEQLFAQTSARALTPALERARAACRGELSALRAGISGPAPVA